MRIFYLLSFLILLSSCNTEKERSSRVILHGQLGQTSDTVLLKTDGRFKLYAQPDTSIVMNVSENTFRDTLDIPKGYYEIVTEENSIKVYLAPGYELKLKNTNDGINFEGEGSTENAYLQKRQQIIAEVGAKNFPRSYYLKLPEDEFLQFVDSLETDRMDLLNSTQLAPDFKKNELNWIKIERARKINTYSFGRKYMDSTYVASEDYPESLKGLQLNDPELLNIDFFRMLMYNYAGSKAEKMGLDAWEYILSENFPVENKKMKEEILYTTGMFSMPRFEKPDAFYTQAQKYLTLEEKKNDITKRYLEVKGLEKGKKAPAFQLKNLDGELVSLEELKGTIVYLDIWTTSCGPCIHEMPEIRKLQNEFKDRDIRFVSIGVESPRERLVNILEQNEVRGIKLYHPEKDDEIMSDYAVTSFPRYVMIDRDGKIIEHMAQRPSNPELKEQLNSLLK